MHEWHPPAFGVHCAPRRDTSVMSFLKHSFLMSFIVSPTGFASSLSDFSFFHFDLWPWSLTYASFVPVLSRYNCFAFSFFFFQERAYFFFFEGALLMQFPVILLALSLNLCWLRWSSLGLAPTPWLPKPACDINGPCTSSSSQWILLACGAPWCSLHNSLRRPTVRVECPWQVVNQHENKGMGKKVIRRF